VGGIDTRQHLVVAFHPTHDNDLPCHHALAKALRAYIERLT
jgi:hypothetical protein